MRKNPSRHIGSGSTFELRLARYGGIGLVVSGYDTCGTGMPPAVAPKWSFLAYSRPRREVSVSSLYHYSGDIADWTDVDRLATSFPEVSLRTGKDGIRQWRVKDKPVAWERPLRAADYEALCDSAPNGAILGVRTPDLVAKEALIASDPQIYFTTPHFDGYPAVLVQLEHIPLDQLEEIIGEAWLDRAPKRMAQAWLRQHEPDCPTSE